MHCVHLFAPDRSSVHTQHGIHFGRYPSMNNSKTAIVAIYTSYRHWTKSVE